MESLVYNLSPTFRREILNGRSYVVVPATLIVPGILPGSDGPLYYPPTENERNPSVWNDQPLTMYHPHDRMGNPTEAKASNDVIVRHRIGRVRNSGTTNGKLHHEFWFNEDKTKKADKRWGTDVMDRILNGRPIELSTGLHVDKVKAPKGYKTHDGRPYSGLIATNYKPDHVAVLPNQKGACSLDDGCGVGITNQLGEGSAMLSADADDPVVNEKRSFLSKVAGWLGVGNADPLPRHPKSQQFQGLARTAAAKGFAHTGQSTQDELPTQEDRTEDQGEDLDDPTVENNDDDCTCNGAGTCTNCMTSKTTNSEEAVMALTANEKKATVDFLVTNCECWKGDENRKVLNALPDDNLVKLKRATESAVENVLVINQIRKDLDADLNLVTTNAIPAFIKKKMDAKDEKKAESGDGEPGDDSEVVENDGMDDANRASTKNRMNKPRNLAEFEAWMPPDASAIWNHAKTVVNEETTRLVANLKAVADRETNPARKALIVNKLKTNPDVAALRDLLTLVGPAHPVRNEGVPFPSYLGAAGTADVVRNASMVGDDPLPTLNFEDLAAEERARKSA